MAAEQRVGTEQVAPLLARLADPVAAVRSAALRALVRLPLDEEAWRQVGDYILYTLPLPTAARNLR
jgi:HEAT repeat protein